jgi:multiple sugar transport system substrate-binding protein
MTGGRRSFGLWVLGACVAAGAVAACSSDTPAEIVTVTVTVTTAPESGALPDSPPAGAISFWSTEVEPERIEAIGRIIDAFTAKTGIEVIRVHVTEDALPETIVEAAEEGRLPEVVLIPADFAVGWAADGFLDADAANGVIDRLGRDTFLQGALDLATWHGQPVAVPSDGWGQLLVYRSDLFSAAGLPPPDTYDAIETAASALYDPGRGIAGIVAATDPDAVFTQQSLEHFALANGCRLVDPAGNVTFDSPNCVEAVDTYARLVSLYGPYGAQDVDSTRAAYLSGSAAMVLWSPFLLDELAGLSDDFPPTCPECEEDPSFLASNSKFVPAFAGPRGEPSQYGQIWYMGIGAGSDVEAGQALIESWLNEGYLAWLETSPEGRFPMRRGTPEARMLFVDGWKRIETGVDRFARLGDLYGDETIDVLITGSTEFDRWGFAQGYGFLVSAMYSELWLPEALGAVLEGELTADEAVARVASLAVGEIAAVEGR